ncbi:hypothetical protein TUN199_12218, partial [Pyrenophora tritici-repentis]
FTVNQASRALIGQALISQLLRARTIDILSSPVAPIQQVHARFSTFRDLPIALPQLTGAHTGEAMAEVVMAIFKQFEITVGKLGYFVLDNAHNNNTTINTLALQMGFSATERRLRCGPHTLNLIGQMLLWGEEKESYDNEETERVNEAENMATWRGDGPLGDFPTSK